MKPKRKDGEALEVLSKVMRGRRTSKRKT